MTSPTRKRRDKNAVRMDAEAEAARRQAEADERKRAEQAEAERSPFFDLAPGDCQLIRRAIRENWLVNPEAAKRIMGEDLMRPIRAPSGKDRLVIAVGRTILAAIEENFRDQVREDRQRRREQRDQSRRMAKPQQTKRVLIVPPVAKAESRPDPEESWLPQPIIREIVRDERLI